MKIGFIGLGNMGFPMASNLLKAGHQLVAFDLSENATNQLKQLGAEVATSVPHLSKIDNLDVLITMLPASQHVLGVYTGEHGVLEHIAKHVLLIDCSTIDPHTAREVAQRAARHGNPMIDAPVSGGTGGAQAGTLTFMVGGEEIFFNQAKPLLSTMGKNIVYCGKSGNGQAAKVANNMLLGISMIATAEAMSLGVSLGVDPHVLANIINTSSGRCWSSEIYNPYPGVVETAPANRGYSGGFGVDLMLKDLGLATEAAKQAKQTVTLGKAAHELYQSFSNQGHGHLDFSAIINLNQD
jgi:3-hydroxyisobutyrate dehydrogenase